MHVGRIRKRINIESRLNPINNPLSNIYGKESKLHSQSQMRNKKFFPLYTSGNNICAPDYMKLTHLPNNQISELHEDKYLHVRKLFPNAYEGSLTGHSMEFPKHRKTYVYNSNTESNSGIGCNVASSCNQSYKKYNIISGREEDRPSLGESGSEKYFAKLAAWNVLLNKEDEVNRILMNKKKSSNDGIYDYLVKGKYII